MNGGEARAGCMRWEEEEGEMPTPNDAHAHIRTHRDPKLNQEKMKELVDIHRIYGGVIGFAVRRKGHVCVCV